MAKHRAELLAGESQRVSRTEALIDWPHHEVRVEVVVAQWFDLWSSPLDDVPWTVVDAFLGQHLSESARIEYRSAISGGRRSRLVETIGAMANSSGGLIFIGVREGEAGSRGRPAEWPTLKRGDVTRGQILDLCRAHLEPFVPVDVGTATPPEGDGAVVVVRVPDVTSNRPVFVEGRGVLVRVGESSVPANVDQLRALFSAGDEARHEISSGVFRAIQFAPNMQQPILAIAAGPVREWQMAHWDDQTLDAIESKVAMRFGDVQPVSASDQLINFEAIDSKGDLARQVWIDRACTIYRRADLTEDDKSIDVGRLATELRQGWRLARDIVELLRPDYVGDLRYRVAVGSARRDFRSPSWMIKKFEHVSRLSTTDQIAKVLDGTLDAQSADGEFVRHVVPTLVLACGYRHVGEYVDELLGVRSASG